MIRGQALGNQFKFGSIIKQINYEQNRDDQAIGRANSRTREKFGESKKTVFPKNIPGIGIPYLREWYHYQKSRGNLRLPEIPFSFNPQKQRGDLRIDQRNEGYEKGSKENPIHLDHNFSKDRSSHWSIRNSIGDLFDIPIIQGDVESSRRKTKGKRGIS